MTAGASFEAQCHAALACYKQDIADGTCRITADNTLVDRLLKAADRYVTTVIGDRARDRAAAELERRIALTTHPADRAQQRTAPRRAVLDEAGRR